MRGEKKQKQLLWWWRRRWRRRRPSQTKPTAHIFEYEKTKYKRMNYISDIRCGFQHLLLGMGCACRSFTVARMDATVLWWSCACVMEAMNNKWIRIHFLNPFRITATDRETGIDYRGIACQCPESCDPNQQFICMEINDIIAEWMTNFQFEVEGIDAMWVVGNPVFAQMRCGTDTTTSETLICFLPEQDLGCVRTPHAISFCQK